MWKSTRESVDSHPLVTGPNLIGLASYFGLLGLGFGLIKYLSDDGGKWIRKKPLPVRGKHLDDLIPDDYRFSKFNKLLSGPFLMLALHYAYYDPSMLWEIKDLSLGTVFGPLPLYFVIYDFFYWLTHMFLHLRSIYAYIHKHHHRQQAPSRGSDDAINVHPIEFVLGHINGIFALFLVCRIKNFHIAGYNLATLLLTGASCFNHSRHDVAFSIGNIEVWASKDHDLHHRIPNKNFGRVLMLWDKIFGTYRPYNYDDPINPMAQLDPTTGKSHEYSKSLTKKVP